MNTHDAPFVAQDLLRLRRKESDLKQIIAQAQGAKTRLKYARADLDNITKKNLVHYQAVGLQASCPLLHQVSVVGR